MHRAIRETGLVLAVGICLGQVAPRPQAFEVAAVKAHDGPLNAMYTFSSSGPRATYHGYTVAYLIMEAFKLKGYQVSLGLSPPDWYTSVYYDIFAKAEGDTPLSRDDFRPMMKSLLAERFHLRFHREQKEMPVYALVVGKNGPNPHISQASPLDVGIGAVRFFHRPCGDSVAGVGISRVERGMTAAVKGARAFSYLRMATAGRASAVSLA